MNRTALSLLLIMAHGLTLSAQTPLTEEPEFLRFGCGDLKFRCGAILSKVSVDARAVYLIPDEGWTADIFLVRHDFEKGWMQRVNEWGYNAFGYTAVGTGHADLPPDDDLKVLSEKNVYGVYQMGMACGPLLAIAHGVSAAYAIKGRSLDKGVCETLALIDPIPPQNVGEHPEFELAELKRSPEDLRAHLWKKWGIGPRYGKENPDSDIGAAGFEALMERYEPDQPAYWAAVQTGFEGDVDVIVTDHLVGLPVLIVGTPGRDREQRKREDALAAWLTEIGAVVDRMELADEGLKNVGGLPMAGDHANEVFDLILGWAERHRLPTTGSGK